MSNSIFSQIENHMYEALKSRLPEAGWAALENDGAIFYMKGKNGTAVDWYVTLITTSLKLMS